jgi:lipopolysaccharide/colanic/teichoic acid biosynthesis glycosyltransferase
VKPGISGLWQVSGRSGTSYESRVNLDVYYVNNWSIWMDYFIFLKTIKEVLMRNGAE